MQWGKRIKSNSNIDFKFAASNVITGRSGQHAAPMVTRPALMQCQLPRRGISAPANARITTGEHETERGRRMPRTNPTRRPYLAGLELIGTKGAKTNMNNNTQTTEQAQAATIVPEIAPEILAQWKQEDENRPPVKRRSKQFPQK